MSTFGGRKTPGGGNSKKGGSGGNVIPLYPIRQIVDPYVWMDDSFQDFPRFYQALETNNGAVRVQLNASDVVPRGALDIDRVSCAHREDGSVACIELRFDCAPTPDNARNKQYRVVFSCTKQRSDNPAHDGPDKLCSQWTALTDNDLLIPTRAPQMFAALDAHILNNGPRPLIIFCEGEKTRQAIDARMARNKTLFENANIIPVASAWLCGKPGAEKTNFAMQPGDHVDRKYVVHGKNARRFDLPYCRYAVVCDNDDEGRAESRTVAQRLWQTYNVAKEDIGIVEAPKGAPPHWDDADDLPPTITDAERAAALLNPTPLKEFWDLKQTGIGRRARIEIDPDSVRNRILALHLIGVEGYLDLADNSYHFSYSPKNWKDKQLSDDDVYDIARPATEKMEHVPTTRLQEKWHEPLYAMARETPRDTIYEETIVAVERGRPLKTEKNKPEMLFINSFNLPDTPYNRAAGRHFMRDYIAACVRPAFNGEPVILQAYYVLFGNEGIGKSTWVRVMAGATPTGVTRRCTDKVTFKDLAAESDNAELHLYHKLAGVTIYELADKPLGGDITRTRADMLKSAVNRGIFRYREIRGKSMATCNSRCVPTVTTNQTEIITFDMGERRWVIINIEDSQTEHPEIIKARLILEKREPTTKEKAILEGHNPGIDWLFANRDALIAHMYDSGDWQGDLSVGVELRALMPEAQENFKTSEPWSERLRELLDGYIGYITNYHAGLLLGITEIYKNEDNYGRRLANAMGEIGFIKGKKTKRIDSKPQRFYYHKNDPKLEKRIYVIETFKGSHEYKAAYENEIVPNQPPNPNEYHPSNTDDNDIPF